jgi:hypothetical protein
MPRQHRYLVQTQAQPGGGWKTVEKLKVIEPAIRLAVHTQTDRAPPTRPPDSLAQAHLFNPPYAAVQVTCGKEIIERIVTRTKAVAS